MKSEITTNSPLETRMLGEKCARRFLKGSNYSGKGAFVIALCGELGGGKTTFVQGFAKGLGLKKRILSPTFVILKKFDIQKSEFNFFYHIDCYRLKEKAELFDLGWLEIISNPENIILVEWADKFKSAFPLSAVFFRFTFLGQNKRLVASSFFQEFEDVLK